MSDILRTGSNWLEARRHDVYAAGWNMTTLYYTLCSFETWYQARELFTVLALCYLVLHAKYA